MSGLEQWLTDPGNVPAMIAAGLALSCVINLGWWLATREPRRAGHAKPLPPVGPKTDRFDETGRLYAEAARRAEARAYPLMTVPDVGPEFDDLGTVTRDDVLELMAAAESLAHRTNSPGPG